MDVPLEVYWQTWDLLALQKPTDRPAMGGVDGIARKGRSVRAGGPERSPLSLLVFCLVSLDFTAYCAPNIDLNGILCSRAPPHCRMSQLRRTLIQGRLREVRPSRLLDGRRGVRILPGKLRVAVFSVHKRTDGQSCRDKTSEPYGHQPNTSGSTTRNGSKPWETEIESDPI